MNEWLGCWLEMNEVWKPASRNAVMRLFSRYRRAWFSAEAAASSIGTLLCVVFDCESTWRNTLSPSVFESSGLVSRP